MSDNQDGIPEREVIEEEVLEKEAPVKDVPEDGALEEVREDELEDKSILSEEPEELPSSAVIHRVKTGPDVTKPEEPKSKRLLYSFLDTARFISLGLVIGILLVVFVIQRNDVFGPSMEPNLNENDAVFVEMVSKYFTSPERGDIITVNATGLDGYTQTEAIIKRVVGLPGETVMIKDGYVYINGVLLDEPYLDDSVLTYVADRGIANGYDNITLGEGEFFFLGDNRSVSEDSRVMGPITKSRIKSHVIFRIYPFDDIGLL